MHVYVVLIMFIACVKHPYNYYVCINKIINIIFTHIHLTYRMTTRERREEYSTSNVVRVLHPSRPLSPNNSTVATDFDNNLGESSKRYNVCWYSCVKCVQYQRTQTHIVLCWFYYFLLFLFGTYKELVLIVELNWLQWQKKNHCMPDTNDMLFKKSAEMQWINCLNI